MSRGMGLWTEADVIRIMCQQQGRSPELPAVLTTTPEQPPYWPYRSQLEHDYAAVLAEWTHHGLVHRWQYEAIRLKLAPKLTLTPDFYLVMGETVHDKRPQFHETKGWAREDAMVKLRQAAALYPEYRFFLVNRVEKQWQWQEVPAA